MDNKTIRIEFDNKILSIYQWSELLGIPASTIRYRYKIGLRGFLLFIKTPYTKKHAKEIKKQKTRFKNHAIWIDGFLDYKKGHCLRYGYCPETITKKAIRLNVTFEEALKAKKRVYQPWKTNEIKILRQNLNNPLLSFIDQFPKRSHGAVRTKKSLILKVLENAT